MRKPPLILIALVLVHYSTSNPIKKYNKYDQILNDNERLQFDIKCSSCVAAISFMSFVVKVDASEPVILEFAKVICKLFAKQSWVVCDGISNQFREEFFYVFRRLSSSSPSQLCGILLPDCADVTDKSQAGWEVFLPPKPKVKAKPHLPKNIEKGKIIRALQLSDLHIDYDYTPGAEANCGLPVCCQNTVPNPSKPAGYWGTAADCDIPIHTFSHMLQHIKKTEEIDYIMMSGDFLNHVDWEYSKEKHIQGIKNISDTIRNVFPNIPIYWAVGNHEGVPVNSFAPHTITEKKFLPTWLYNTISNISNDWLDNVALDTNNYRGSYSMYTAKGLKLISLNTGYCETTNFFLYLNQSDPDGTMSWLVAELYMSEQAGEVVHIMAHIPPGNEECLEGWARNYYKVVQRFSSTIVGQFFGHVHLDYFIMFYEDMNDINSKPINVGYAAPSVTTFSDVNPGYRIFSIDSAQNYNIVDIDNYWTDINTATEDNPPIWQKLYSAKEAYGMKDLSPNSWNTVLNRIVKNKVWRKQFIRYSYRVEDVKCDFMCEQYLLCQLRSGHHNQTAYCIDKIESSKKYFYHLDNDETYLRDNRVPF